VRSTEEDLLLWEQRINERILSRMTIEDWCKRNGISKYKYHYWNHLIREKQKSNKEDTFAEITPILSNADNTISNSAKAADFQIFFNNIQITVPTNFNPASLTGLMKVLKEL